MKYPPFSLNSMTTGIPSLVVGGRPPLTRSRWTKNTGEPFVTRYELDYPYLPMVFFISLPEPGQFKDDRPNQRYPLSFRMLNLLR